VRFVPNPVAFSDLRDESPPWQDEEKMQRVIDEPSWRPSNYDDGLRKGIYSRLFDPPRSQYPTETAGLFFRCGGAQPRTPSRDAMSMLIANAMAERASGMTGRPRLPCSMMLVLLVRRFWRQRSFSVPDGAQAEFEASGASRRRLRILWELRSSHACMGRDREKRKHEANRSNLEHERAERPTPPECSDTSGIKRFSSPQKGRYGDVLVIGEKAETTQVVSTRSTPVDYGLHDLSARARYEAGT